MIHFLNQRSTVSSVATQHEPELILDPRRVAEDEFPVDGTKTEQLKFLLNYAVLAPSSHNTQPWQFKIADDAIELYADKTRALPVDDPDYRELTISCGVALFHLRIATRHFGYADVVKILPDCNNSNLLAQIRLGSKRITRLEENLLFRAIPKRCTNRLEFKDSQLPKSLILELESACCSEGNWLQICTQRIFPAKRDAVINLITEGDRLQMADSLFRRELAPGRSHNGIPAHAQGMSQRFDPLAPLISFTIRSFDLGKSQADKDYRLAIAAPVLMSIFSKGDRVQDWIATGEALAHLLLRARIDDVWASFLNQPIQVPHLRSRLQGLFSDSGYPQILVRLGYASEVQPTPRRSVDEVVDG